MLEIDYIQIPSLPLTSCTTLSKTIFVSLCFRVLRLERGYEDCSPSHRLVVRMKGVSLYRAAESLHRVSTVRTVMTNVSRVRKLRSGEAK